MEGDTAEGAATTYKFMNPTSQDIYISVDTWNHRMYPPKCSSDYSEVKVIVKKDGVEVGRRWYYDQKGYGTIALANQSGGNFEIEVTINWGPNTVRDYVVRVYARNKVTIKDALGQSREKSTWD